MLRLEINLMNLLFFFITSKNVCFSSNCHEELHFFKAELQNFLDPVLAKPESWYKARF